MITLYKLLQVDIYQGGSWGGADCNFLGIEA